jgi:AcrR family transcriptional regulator
MPKVSEEYLEARRQQVLHAAEICFARKGFSETTMQDIARAAGVSYGVVYHYFDSKEDIIVAGSTPALEARAERFAQAEQKGHAVEVLKEVLRLSCERWADPASEQELRLRAQLFAESLRNRRIGEIIDGARDYRARYRAIVQRGQERGEINAEVDPEAVAQVFVAIQLGMETLKSADPTIDVHRYLHATAALLDGHIWTDQCHESRNGDGDETDDCTRTHLERPGAE